MTRSPENDTAKTLLRKDRPYYLQIGDHLTREIKQMETGDRLPPERELADRYNVDRATLRRAMLNLEEEGYIVRQQGRGTFVDKGGNRVTTPQSDPSSNVALIIPDTELPSHRQMLKGVMLRLGELNHKAWTTCALLDPEIEKKLLRDTLHQEVKGVITVPLFDNWKDPEYQKLLNKIQQQGKQVVLMEQYVPGRDLRTVMMDKVQAGYMVAEHLIMAGHRDIALFSPHGHSSAGNQYYQGFRQALTHYGVEINPERVFDISPRECARESYQTAVELFEKRRTPCSAVFGAQFSICYGLFRALRDLKKSQEVDLVGEDLDFNPEMSHLTYIRQPLEQIGRTAVDLLFEERNQENREFKQHRLLPPELVPAGSTPDDFDGPAG